MFALRLALRTLGRTRGFAIPAIATIALAVGAGCAVFGLVNAVLLRPLPYHDADRLVGLWHAMPGLGLPQVKQAPGTFALYRQSATSFEDMGLTLTLAATLGYRDSRRGPERARVAYVTASVFTTLGVRPLLGRVFIEADEKTGAPRVAILSERLWRTRFGADARVLDGSIDLDGEPYRIVGVMPESFAFPESATPVWIPLDPVPTTYVGGFAYPAIARLRPGVTPAAAQQELTRLLVRLPERYPEARPGVSTASVLDQVKLTPLVHPMRDDVIGGFDRVLWLIAGTVVLLILVAFSNVASLLLVRIDSRQRELALRAALGASPWGVLRIWIQISPSTVRRR